MKTLLKGGYVVSGEATIHADILIEDEIIRAVGTGLNEDGAEIRDVSGKLLFPGFIDAHTHFDLDVCNTTTADDFYTGGRSAIRGGTTMVIDFACPNKGETLEYGLKLWHEKAEKRGCACDYGFHMTIDDWNPDIIREIPEMFAQGISSFKMYMTYPAMMIGDKDMFCALQKMKEYGGIVGVHCENSGVIDALIEQHKAAGHLDPTAHPESRPAVLEAEAISRLIKMASIADVPVVIVHLSSKAGMEEVRFARAQGNKVFVETCPQYLVLDDSCYALPDFVGGRYICAPPIRKPDDREALWAALAANEIQTISTDHCSFTLAQKDAGREDFTKIPGGLPGVETRGLLVYSEGVATGRITKEQMCKLLSETPAKLYGCYPQKGALLPGSDADIVVFDPEEKTVIRASEQEANVDYNPYEGYEASGSIDSVFLRGTMVVSKGNVLKNRNGKFVFRGKSQLL